MKFLIDTGSTRSFILSNVANKYFRKKLKPATGTVVTAHGDSKITQLAMLPCGELFNEKHLNLPFRVFDFHTRFQLLLGLDNLKVLKASVDLESNLLRTPKIILPLYFTDKCLCPEEKVESYLINARTIQQIKVEIDNVKNGEAIVDSCSFPGLQIPTCIVNVKDSQAFVHITNTEETPVSLHLVHPLNAEPVPRGQFIDEEITLNNLDSSPRKFNHKKHWIDYSKFRLNHLCPDELRAVRHLIHDYADLFQEEDGPLSFTSEVKHHIRTMNENPVFVKPYRYPHIYKEEVNRQVEKLLAQKIVRPSNSPYNAPLWIVPKKLDASGKPKFRMVIDFRRLNESTIQDKFPLPNISELLDKLGRSTYFSTLDLAQGFHQIELDESSIQKTAFSTDTGHFEYLRMPFGLCNAPATFQRMVNNCLRGLNNEICLVYLDDILIFSTSLQEHIVRLRKIFDRLRQANLKIQPDKTEFLRKELAYLGHVVTPDGVKPNPEKIRAIEMFPIPRTRTEIKRFLGALGYYRRFIEGFAHLTKPLTSALKKNGKITPASPEFLNSFKTCKTLLCNDPILKYPDFQKPFRVTCDASDVATGAVLSQDFDGADLPIAYTSKTLTDSEKRYATNEKELLAIIHALKAFRPYVYGQKFQLFTDHKPLQWLFALKDPNSKLYRWRLKLSDFNFDIHYKPGKSNYVADALSRIELNHLESDLPQDRPPINIQDLQVNAPIELPHPIPINDPSADLELDQLPSPRMTEEEERAISEILAAFNQSRQPNNEIDIQSMDVQAPSTSTQAENPLAGSATIPQKDEAVNHAKNQIILKLVTSIPGKPSVIHLFNNTKTRVTVEFSQHHLQREVIDFVKEYIRPKTCYALFFKNDKDNKFYQRFAEIIGQTFQQSEIKFTKFSKLLEDIESDEDVEELIKSYHIGKTNHRGIPETYEHLKRNYFWPNQKLSIQNFINRCELCLRTKYERNPIKVKLNLTPTASRPFETLHIDKIALERTKFLSIFDPFSKYAQMYVVPTNTSLDTVRALLKYFTHHGVPKQIVSDNGAELNSSLVKELLADHNIEIHFISSQHPQSNGPVERFHSTIIEHVRLLNLRDEFKRDDIETKIQYALIAYNNSVHSATSLTPFEVVQGHIAEDTLLKLNLEQQLTNDYLNKHREKMKALYSTLKEHTVQLKEKILEQRNPRREDAPELPSTVYVKTKQLQSKTKPIYHTEQVVSTNRTKGTAVIQPRHGNTQPKIHISNVKRPRKLPRSRSSSSSSYSPSEYDIPISPVPSAPEPPTLQPHSSPKVATFYSIPKEQIIDKLPPGTTKRPRSTTSSQESVTSSRTPVAKRHCKDLSRIPQRTPTPSFSSSSPSPERTAKLPRKALPVPPDSPIPPIRLPRKALPIPPDTPEPITVVKPSAERPTVSHIPIPHKPYRSPPSTSSSSSL